MSGPRFRLALLALVLLSIGAPSTGCRRVGRAAKARLALLLAPETGDGAHAAPAPVSADLFALPARLAPRPRLMLPALLPAATARARRGAPGWQRLQAWCDEHLAGRTEWPDGNAYPGPPHVGKGYQGDEYLNAVASFALCHQVGRALGQEVKAVAWAARGVDVLIKMSEPSGPHAPDPLNDSGYGIRFFGVGMALGLDWLYDRMTPGERARVVAALDRWITAFDERGFGRDHPQGNYFAGYYAAKALGALAAEGESPRASVWLADWLRRLHGAMVQPFYAHNLAGGGWPEGWNYGPLATLNMTWPAFALETAKGVDLIHHPRAPFAFPIDQARQLVHFAWPSRRTLDDRGDQTPGENPSMAHPAVFTVLSGLLEHWKDPLAPQFHAYAAEVRRAVGDEGLRPWQELLFWNDTAAGADYKSLPLSYVSRGMGTVAMRSGWDASAVWSGFSAGPYVNNPDSGEMFFDQGALTIVRGGQPLLVNTPAALYRHSPGTNDGEGMFDLIYADLFGNNAQDRTLRNRTLFNIFYVRGPRYGQYDVVPGQGRTRLALADDLGTAVVLRGENLEDMYWPARGNGPKLVEGWSRQVTYVRPGRFVVDDATEAARPDADQWLSFHLPARPRVTGTTFDVSVRGTFLGRMTSLLPKGARARVVDVFDKRKVFRVELRPAGSGARQRWLTAFDVPAAGAAPAQISLLPGPSAAVLFSGGGVSTIVARLDDAGGGWALRYRFPDGPTTHVVTGLPPSTSVHVELAGLDGQKEVRLGPGPGPSTSPAGTLTFRSTPAGQLTGADGKVLP